MSIKILLSGKGNMQNYINAVTSCGADAEGSYLPKASSDGYDGLILCGGGDIHPKFYNQEIDGSNEAGIDIERDECEFALITEFLKSDKPILGICRGHQVLNVYFGGNMIQHVSTAEIHRKDTDAVHKVSAVCTSCLTELYGNEFFVNSMHHQALDFLGKGLKVTLRSSSDGIIEAVEHESLPVIGVQFHPERMCAGMKRSDTVDGIGIFEYFLNMCKK